MRWTSFTTLLAVLVFTNSLYAGGGASCGQKLKVTQEKANLLLARWEEAAASLKGLKPEELAQLGKDLQSVAQACPVGSRII